MSREEENKISSPKKRASNLAVSSRPIYAPYPVPPCQKAILARFENYGALCNIPIVSP
jgi:hypothetical protein